jgi:rare lipoprotein A
MTRLILKAIDVGASAVFIALCTMALCGNLPTAAYRSLPFGTRGRVTDLATNRSVEFVITDRGPRVRDRVLDLSLAAARRLGITDRGVPQVRVEVIS